MKDKQKAVAALNEIARDDPARESLSAMSDMRPGWAEEQAKGFAAQVAMNAEAVRWDIIAGSYAKAREYLTRNGFTQEQAVQLIIATLYEHP